jgi:hypothetical protein
MSRRHALDRLLWPVVSHLVWFASVLVACLGAITALYVVYVPPTVYWMLIAGISGVVIGISAVEIVESRRRWVQRESPCRCHLEAGDSVCPAHPPDDDELAYAESMGCPYDLSGRR